MLTRLAHERQPSSELPFVAPTCSNFSGLLPHQTKTVEVSPMSLSIIRHRLALPTCRWTTNCHVTYPSQVVPACSHAPPALFSSPVQAFPVSVPPSSATLVLCRGDLQLLANPLRLVLAQVITAQQSGHERR